MKSNQVVVAGHICLDITPTFNREDTRKINELFVPGKLINVKNAVISTGGPVSNTGLALIKLGISTALTGKVGSDVFGKIVLDLLKERGINSGMTVSEADTTSYTVILCPPGYDRIFLHNTGANDTFTSDDLDESVLKECSLFHFGYPPLMKRIYEDDGVELEKIFKKAKSYGATTSLDMSLPDVNSASGRVNWDSVLKRVLPYVDIYIPSVEETMFMIRRDEYDRINNKQGGKDILDGMSIDDIPRLTEILLGYGPKIVVLKCGYKGYSIKTASREKLETLSGARPGDLDNWANREIHTESYNVKDIASASGSGDSSIAGFYTAFLRGYSIEDSIKIACVVGAQNIRVYDAVSGIKDWEETIEQFNSDMPNNRLSSEALWKYNEKQALWYRA